MAEPVRFRVDLTDRLHHLVRVELTVPDDVETIDLSLPTWTPGSYTIRNYARHIQWLEAADGNGGPVTLTPMGLGRWTAPQGGPLTVTYELYANDLTVRTNHVDDHHALIIPAATFLLVDGCRDRRHEVAFDDGIDEGRVWSLLPRIEEPPCFVADDFDHLVDSAFEVGDFPYADYDVRGVPHRFVWAGHGPAPDLQRVADDAAAIGEAAAELLGGDLPIDEYTFLCVGWDDQAGGGGLEHRDGAVLMMPVTQLGDPDKYARLQSLIAHEYLHLWNVKRLVPAELVRPDLTAPTHTTALWVAEGWTDHYDDLLPLRAGVWDLKRYLKTQRDLIDDVTTTPGAAYQSVQQASYEAWIKLYLRDENSPNVGVNYYGHGALLAWCLDLLIRRAEPKGPGLDGVLRDLWQQYGGTGGGYEHEDVEAAVRTAAGDQLRDFFGRHVSGTELPPIEDLLDAVGLRLTATDEEVPPDLGVKTSQDGRAVVLSHVLRDRPAWQAGLTGGDRVVAIDGVTIAAGELETLLKTYDAGDRITVAAIRGPRLVEREVELGPPRPKRELTPVEQPTADQRAAFTAWTGHELDDIAERSSGS